MSSKQIIEQCQQLHGQARSTGFSPEVEWTGSRDESELFCSGQVLWGAIVKANNALYKVGKSHLPGCIVYSFDSHYDANVQDLSAVAELAFQLRGTHPAEPSLRGFAAVVSADDPHPLKQIVPSALTHGRKVFYAQLQIFRERLPDGFLIDSLIPLIADPVQKRGVMLPPLGCWSRQLIEQWNSLAAGKPAGHPTAWAPISFEEFAANPLSISSPASAELRRIMVRQRLRNPALRVAEEHGSFSMEITERGPDPATDFYFNSHGVPLVVHHRCARNLMGVEIRFERSASHSGFRFHRKSDDSES